MSKQTKNSEEEEVSVNVGGICAGFVLLLGIIWSLWNGQMKFAYLTVSLLSVLAVCNQLVNRRYE